MITRNRYNLEGDTFYQGKSTDTKPTKEVPLNSMFLELDTGKFYYFDGYEWFENGSAPLKAKLLKIMGNTLVWNQLVKNGDFANGTENWSATPESTISVSNGELTVTMGGNWNNDARQSLNTYEGHKYLCSVEIKTDTTESQDYIFGQFGATTNANFVMSHVSSEYERYVGTFTPTEDAETIRFSKRSIASGMLGKTYTVKNVFMVDLTRMFGSGNEPDSVVEFMSLNPKQPYDTGSLANLTVSSVKTTGRNLLNFTNSRKQNGITFTYDSETGGVKCKGTATGGNAYNDKTATLSVAKRYCYLKAGNYKLTIEGTKNGNNYPRGYFCPVYVDGKVGTASAFYNEKDIELNSDAYGYFRIQVSNGETVDTTVYPMIRYADADSDFEIYKERTTGLPVLNYFPDGMKSAGSAYDELTPSKATKKIGSVDLGTLSWTAVSGNRFISTGIASLVKAPADNSTEANILCAEYETQTYSGIVDSGYTGIAINANSPNTGNICIKDTNYSDASLFKKSLEGVILNYELDTPVEQDINIAMNYWIEWGGTEQIIPSTVPIIADIEYPDGERENQEFTYREVAESVDELNNALSIMMGRQISVDNPQEPLDILMKGE